MPPPESLLMTPFLLGGLRSGPEKTYSRRTCKVRLRNPLDLPPAPRTLVAGGQPPSTAPKSVRAALIVTNMRLQDPSEMVTTLPLNRSARSSPVSACLLYVGSTPASLLHR